ncbi:MAG: fibronectin type III domain-containing protein, partial [Kiritimatiellae bacterium]|nr:fibronectin type III domain-containing protein [Kiritimatiellia bacterium]
MKKQPLNIDSGPYTVRRGFRCLQFCAFFWVLSECCVQAAFTAYDFPHIDPQSARFRVKVNGQEVHVYHTRVGWEDNGYHYAHFAIDSAVQVEVIGSDAPQLTYVSPRKLGIQPVMTGAKSFTFTIREPRQYMVTTYDRLITSGFWRGERYVLFLFVDPPEVNPPKLGDPGVINAKDYGSFINAVNACPAGGTVYVPAGTYPIAKGMTFIQKNNITIYLAPGALLTSSWETPVGERWKALLWIYRSKNLTLKGRGVIEGRGLPFRVYGSENITIDGIVVREVAYIREYTGVVETEICTGVRYRNVKVLGRSTNDNIRATNGLQVESCTDVIVENSLATASDDSILVQQSDAYTRGVRNVHFHDCLSMKVFYRNNNPGVPTGDVTFDDHTSLCSGFLLTSQGAGADAPVTGCRVSNATLDLGNCQRFVDLGYGPDKGAYNHSVDNWLIENLTVLDIRPGRAKTYALSIKGKADRSVSVTFKNLVVNGQLVTSFQQLKNMGFEDAEIVNAQVSFTSGGGESPPAAPGSLAATALCASSVRLTWRDNSANEEQFKLDRRQSGTTEWVRIATLPANTAAYTDTGLPAGTRFYYQVKAWNTAGGNSPCSNVADATTAAAQPPPAAPSGLSAAALSSSAIRLEWTDNARDEDGFRLDRRQSGTTVWAQIAALPANTTTHTDTGLPAGTKFYYTVQAVRGADLSDRSELSDATTRPAPHEQSLPPGAVWRYRLGTAAPSQPAGAWHQTNFDDSTWATGPAPFGYGPLEYGTDLESAMKGACTCVFLRRALQLESPAQVTCLSITVEFDDGFVLWLNGQELARANVGAAAYEPVAFDAVSSGYVAGSAEQRTVTLTGGALPALGAANVLALQLVNAAAGSGDLMGDVQITFTTERLPAA